MDRHESSPIERWLKDAVVVGMGIAVLILGHEVITEGPQRTTEEVIEFFSGGPGGELIKHMNNPFLDGQSVHPATSLEPVDVSHGPFKVIQG